MANPIPNPPYKQILLDEFGKLSRPWAAWFRETMIRLGGSVALSLPEINEQVDELNQQLEDMQTVVDDLEDQIDGTSNELTQGPNL